MLKDPIEMTPLSQLRKIMQYSNSNETETFDTSYE